MAFRLDIFHALVVQSVRESLRQPVILLVTTVAILLAALMPFMTAFQFGEENRLVMDGILALHFLLGAYLAGAVSQLGLGLDLQGRAAGLILCKPVRRAEFFLARFTGVLVVLALFSFCLWTAAVLSQQIGPLEHGEDERAGLIILAAVAAAHGISGMINYRRGSPYAEWSFFLLPIALGMALSFLLIRDLRADVASAGRVLASGVRLLPAFGLVYLGLGVLAAAAHTLAARFSSAPVLAGFMTLLLVLGLSLEPLIHEWRGAVAESLRVMGIAWLMPSWSLFWPADALYAGRSLPLTYLGWAALYSVTWTAFFLSVGTAWFAERELG